MLFSKVRVSEKVVLSGTPEYRDKKELRGMDIIKVGKSRQVV